MKRKQFVKQLQAHGIPRNMANELAETSRTKYGPYIKGLGRFLNIYAMLRNGADPLAFYAAPGGGGQ